NWLAPVSQDLVQTKMTDSVIFWNHVLYLHTDGLLEGCQRLVARQTPKQIATPMVRRGYGCCSGQIAIAGIAALQTNTQNRGPCWVHLARPPPPFTRPRFILFSG
ncbi:unnamed protein product, partial [Ectocarpus fasciculatus]